MCICGLISQKLSQAVLHPFPRGPLRAASPLKKVGSPCCPFPETSILFAVDQSGRVRRPLLTRSTDRNKKRTILRIVFFPFALRHN